MNTLIKQIFKQMTQVIINGQTYTGSNVKIKNNIVFVDGEEVKSDSKQITININGNVDNFYVDHANTIHVDGNVNTLKTTSGDVTCNNVNLGVTTTSGDVECEDINGNVKTTSGDVKAKTITGLVTTVSGDIRKNN